MADDFHFKHSYCTSTPGDYVQNAAHYDRWLSARDAARDAEVAEKARADALTSAARYVASGLHCAGMRLTPEEVVAYLNREAARTPDSNGDTP